MKLKRFLLLFLILPSFFLTFLSSIVPITEASELDDLTQKIEELSKQLETTQSKVSSLKGELQYMDSQIQLTNLKIDQTNGQMNLLEAQISDLSKKIGVLDVSLNEISVLFINRVVATYKAGKFNFLDVLLSSNGFTDFFKRAYYLKSAQSHDRKILITMEEVRLNYDAQKKEKEEKQQQLEALKAQLAQQKANLDRQKLAKQDLLTATKNDEKKYQELLAQAQAEYQALQAILAGQGDEVKVGEVKAGETIASVISGSSCNSSGTHLHFTVANRGGSTFNPFNYLKSVDHENCSGPGTCSPGDPFNPTGGWEWPVSPKITFSQGYGNTWAINNTWVGRIYNFHNGIDVKGVSADVRAVRDGVLYRGSYGGSGGCRLQYVRVEHNGEDLVTYYLHVNYVKI